ncbi:hypothetical protein GOBAR_DD27604 [Gossypium barbadense]|nr:hypothetical protein GOBAR_DD27604 [Gossypium barbadense]
MKHLCKKLKGWTCVPLFTISFSMYFGDEGHGGTNRAGLAFLDYAPHRGCTRANIMQCKAEITVPDSRITLQRHTMVTHPITPLPGLGHWQYTAEEY